MDPAGLRILVADDDHDTVETMALLLAQHGHETLTAYDGATALDLARLRRPDLMLLDLAMPKLDGYAVARQLRLLPDFQHVVIACVSGYGTDDHRRLARDAGCDTHLIKPISLTALESLLQMSAALRAACARRSRDQQRLVGEVHTTAADLCGYWERFQALAAEAAQLRGQPQTAR